MSDVIRELHRDHRNMARLLGLLEHQMAMLDSVSAPDYGLLEDVMHYMVHYADEYHHAKEDLLFDRLVERDPDSRATITGLKLEHGELAQKGTVFFQSIRSVGDGTIMAKDRFRAEAQDYIKTLRSHMKTEEDRVFPTIERTLAAEDWADIDEKVQRREDPIFGDIVQDRYRQLYDHIMRRAQ